MANRFGELVTSPYDEEPRLPKRRLLAIALGFIVVVVIGIAAWFAFGRDDASPDTQQTDIADLSSTSSTTFLSEISLMPYESEPSLLNHPTVLPVGWEACRVLDDASRGDRFCDPLDDESWIQVSLRYPNKVRADGAPPTGDDERGVWIERGKDNTVAYRRGPAYIVVSESGTLDADALLSVATSIPLVTAYGDLYGSPEPRMDLDQVSDEDLASLVMGFDPDPSVKRRTGDVQVSTSTFSLNGFWGDGPMVAEFVYTVPRPRLMTADRPIIVGESQERDRAVAFWLQGGYVWRLEGQLTAESVTLLTTDLIEQIDRFPTQ